jgi:hypothetical protein
VTKPLAMVTDDVVAERGPAGELCMSVVVLSVRIDLHAYGMHEHGSSDIRIVPAQNSTTGGLPQNMRAETYARISVNCDLLRATWCRGVRNGDGQQVNGSASVSQEARNLSTSQRYAAICSY